MDNPLLRLSETGIVIQFEGLFIQYIGKELVYTAAVFILQVVTKVNGFHGHLVSEVGVLKHQDQVLEPKETRIRLDIVNLLGHTS